MLTAEQVQTIFDALCASYDAFAARHGSAFVKTTVLVNEIVDEAVKQSAGGFTREQALEAWTCVLVADAMAASGAIPQHKLLD